MRETRSYDSVFTYDREVAQLGRVLGLGPRCRRFESCLPDMLIHKRQRLNAVVFLYFMGSVFVIKYLAYFIFFGVYACLLP